MTVFEVVKTGLMRLLADPDAYLRRARVGLCVNPTAVDDRLRHAADLLRADPKVDLRLLFGPEHGVRACAQDMVSVEHQRDESTGLEVVSLYGATYDSLTPTREQLAKIDVLVFDIQDIGSRYYTYAATLAFCMRAAGEAGVSVVVLDRPNPIGGVAVEGGGILPELVNFCGLFPLPQRHGLTLGELALLYQRAFEVRCELLVVPCENWRRERYFDATGLSWVMPSPNMPTLQTALVYPGMCLVEGTCLSEGRGTTKPFELIGAPYVDGCALAARLTSLQLPGVSFRSCFFRPCFHKHAGEVCGGVEVYVTCREDFLPYRTGLAVLWAVHDLWPEAFAWRRTPYEFRSDVPAIDLLVGTPAFRLAVDAGEPWEKTLASAFLATPLFDAHREGVLLY